MFVLTRSGFLSKHFVLLCSSFVHFLFRFYDFRFRFTLKNFSGSMTKIILFSSQYQTVLQTNGDGTFSLIQVDPSTLTNNPSIITLPDGTTAQVQGVATVSHEHNNLFPIKERENIFWYFKASHTKRRNDSSHSSNGRTIWEYAGRSLWSFSARWSIDNNQRRWQWWVEQRAIGIRNFISVP